MAIVYDNDIIQSGSDDSEAEEDKEVPDHSEKDSEVKTGHSSEKDSEVNYKTGHRHQAQAHGPSHQARSPSHQQAGSSHQSPRDHCGSSYRYSRHTTYKHLTSIMYNSICANNFCITPLYAIIGLP